ncbi:MAG: DUF5947 family protein [Bryobacteraceae bacterium]|jgi:uncharacterized protein DUF5947
MSTAGVANPIDVLRRFAGKPRAHECCDLCGAELAVEHPHLVEPSARKLHCTCPACALLFSSQSGSRYKRVPRRVRYLADFRLTDAQWEGLMIPINMAFFFKSSVDGRVIALYPSPAGATESQLPLETWADLADENPPLGDIEPDVEALLVNRLGFTRGFSVPEYYLLPIDECYKLVWLIRTHWRGLSGGTEVWKQLQQYFAGLQDRSGESHA